MSEAKPKHPSIKETRLVPRLIDRRSQAKAPTDQGNKAPTWSQDVMSKAKPKHTSIKETMPQHGLFLASHGQFLDRMAGFLDRMAYLVGRVAEIQKNMTPQKINVCSCHFTFCAECIYRGDHEVCMLPNGALGRIPAAMPREAAKVEKTPNEHREQGHVPIKRRVHRPRIKTNRRPKNMCVSESVWWSYQRTITVCRTSLFTRNTQFYQRTIYSRTGPSIGICMMEL